MTEHLRTYVTGRDGLLFPGPSGAWLQPTRFRDLSGRWRAVREAVCRPLNFHDLRATGATRMAQRGAHVAEVQPFSGTRHLRPPSDTSEQHGAGWTT